MDLYDRCYTMTLLYYELSDFARVAAPYLRTAYIKFKDYNIKRERYVLIKVECVTWAYVVEESYDEYTLFKIAAASSHTSGFYRVFGGYFLAHPVMLA